MMAYFYVFSERQILFQLKNNPFSNQKRWFRGFGTGHQGVAQCGPVMIVLFGKVGATVDQQIHQV